MKLLIAIALLLALMPVTTAYEPSDIIQMTLDYMEQHMVVGYDSHSVERITYTLVEVSALNDRDIILFYEIVDADNPAWHSMIGFGVNPDENTVLFVLKKRGVNIST